MKYYGLFFVLIYIYIFWLFFVLKILMVYMKNTQEQIFILKRIKLAEFQHFCFAVLIQDIDRNIL